VRITKTGTIFSVLIQFLVFMATSSEINDRISRIKWFHRIELGNGITTPGWAKNQKALLNVRFPADLSGKTFLDICAMDGYFSFEAEKRGAARVLATDSFIWDGNVPGMSNEGFLTAREILGSKVEDKRIDCMNISTESVGTWDVVFFAGVIYHLKNPWAALERAASVTKELLIVETATDLRFTMRPALAIYRKGELVKDDTNWTAPNISGLKAMLADCGFQRIEVVYDTGILHGIYYAFSRAFQFGASPVAALRQGRCAIHAYR
jgi:tRNA (mo5U34)-methyltransferase